MDETKKKTDRIKAGTVVKRCLLMLLVTILLLIFALYGVMFVLAKGPSPHARDLFVMSVRETSAVGFLANLFFRRKKSLPLRREKMRRQSLRTRIRP